MSLPHRQTALPSHIRPPAGLANSSASNLQARIDEKKLELENLKQLRDLSAGLAGQMQQLEEKLATLSNGTEAVAAVLGNWHNVLRAIHLASVKIPRPKGAEGAEIAEDTPLPRTLVRIPIHQAEAVPNEVEAAEAAGE